MRPPKMMTLIGLSTYMSVIHMEVPNWSTSSYSFCFYSSNSLISSLVIVSKLIVGLATDELSEKSEESSSEPVKTEDSFPLPAVNTLYFLFLLLFDLDIWLSWGVPFLISLVGVSSFQLFRLTELFKSLILPCLFLVKYSRWELLKFFTTSI